jgi:hypothetical protein
MSKPKILHVISDSGLGGINKVLNYLNQALRDKFKIWQEYLR